jgi:hypothetical protein
MCAEKSITKARRSDKSQVTSDRIKSAAAGLPVQTHPKSPFKRELPFSTPETPRITPELPQCPYVTAARHYFCEQLFRRCVKFTRDACDFHAFGSGARNHSTHLLGFQWKIRLALVVLKIFQKSN